LLLDSLYLFLNSEVLGNSPFKPSTAITLYPLNFEVVGIKFCVRVSNSLKAENLIFIKLSAFVYSIYTF